MNINTNEEWIRDYYTAVDEANIPVAMRYFGSESVMVFANEPPIVGVDRIEKKSLMMFEWFKAMSHDLKHIWEPENGVVILELDVTYIKHDDSEIKLSGAAFASVKPAMWAEQRIYVDPAPAFARG